MLQQNRQALVVEGDGMRGSGRWCCALASKARWMWCMGADLTEQRWFGAPLAVLEAAPQSKPLRGMGLHGAVKCVAIVLCDMG
jgi:hypothetical protein